MGMQRNRLGQMRTNGSWVSALVVSALVSAGFVKSSGAQELVVRQTEEQIEIRRQDKVILAYLKQSPPAPDGIDAIYERSGCLHPVNTPAGMTVTQMFPVDHAHQHGIFSAWVNTTYDGQAVDFWNLAGGTGRVRHERVVATFQDPDATGFEVDLIHRATAAGIDVLRESWKVSAYITDGSYNCFDLETTQRALTDKPLLVNEYHYGGVALRGLTRWLSPDDSYVRRDNSIKIEPSGFLNDQGSDRVKGNHQHAKWVALEGSIDGKQVTIAVLCHADNFRAPQAARLHPTKPYFCFAPCVDGTFTIDQQHPYAARYRFLVTDTPPNPSWLDAQWQTWCAP